MNTNRRSLIKLLSLAAAAILIPFQRCFSARELEPEEIKWITVSVSVGDKEQYPFYGCNAEYFRQEKQAPYGCFRNDYAYVCKMAKPRNDGRVSFEFSANGKILCVIATLNQFIVDRRADVISACLQAGRRACLQRLDHVDQFGGSPYMLDEDLQPLLATHNRVAILDSSAFGCVTGRASAIHDFGLK